MYKYIYLTFASVVLYNGYINTSIGPWRVGIQLNTFLSIKQTNTVKNLYVSR